MVNKQKTTARRRCLLIDKLILMGKRHGNKRLWLVTACSAIWPGLGHLQLQQAKKASVIMVIALLAAATVALYPVVWLLALRDSYSLARQRENGLPLRAWQCWFQRPVVMQGVVFAAKKLQRRRLSCDYKVLDNRGNSHARQCPVTLRQPWQPQLRIMQAEARSANRPVVLSESQRQHIKSALEARYPQLLCKKLFFSGDTTIRVAARCCKEMQVNWTQEIETGLAQLDAGQGWVSVPYRVCIGVDYKITKQSILE